MRQKAIQVRLSRKDFRPIEKRRKVLFFDWVVECYIPLNLQKNLWHFAELDNLLGIQVQC